jgi:hypothetical protein
MLILHLGTHDARTKIKVLGFFKEYLHSIRAAAWPCIAIVIHYRPNTMTCKLK